MSKIIVISSDAMVGEDLEYFETLPNYKKYLAGGAKITNVSSIYPTVTHPAHVSMMTGMYPDRHGVFSNMLLIPGSDPTPWQWNYELLHCTDIFRAAKEKGLTTAAVMWPLTACNPAVDYHIPCCWTQSPEETIEGVFRENGASEKVLEIVRKNLHLFADAERNHPQVDEFSLACTADIVRKYSPDLVLVHPANIDSIRHQRGLFGPHLQGALDDLDRWLGMVCRAAEENGSLEQYNIFIVSDHGQLDARRNIGLNVLFAENGLIRIAEDGTIADWDAWCLSNGMSCLVFLKDKDDASLREKVAILLNRLLEEGVYGFSRIYTEEECRREERYGGDFSFVLETDGYTAFGDYYTRPLVRARNSSDYRFGSATHGYLPWKGPQPILLAKGPDIQENVVLSGSHIINEAPTYAKILGVDLGDTDGHSIDEILKASCL